MNLKKQIYPFNEILSDGFNYRTFSSDVDSHELKWHLDEEDRVVICEHETNWQVQLENELPQRIIKNKPIFIPVGVWHRVIKGDGDLVVKVKKIKHIKK